MKSNMSKLWISCVVAMTLFTACGGDSNSPLKKPLPAMR